MTGDTVECLRCGTNFELWASGGYCTNPDCGAQHPEAKSDSSSGGDDAGSSGDSDDTSTSSSDDTDSTTNGNNDQTFECNSCGAEVDASFDFCNQCGNDLISQDSGKDDDSDDGTVTCPSCGHESSNDFEFCANCGTELPDTPSDDTGGSDDDQTTPVGESAGGTPNVEIEVAGERMSVNHGDIIGGEVRETLVANGTDRDEARYVHREHIEFELRDDGVYIIDHGRNTTEVDGQSLSEGDEVQISDGSTIKLSGIAQIDVHTN